MFRLIRIALVSLLAAAIIPTAADAQQNKKKGGPAAAPARQAPPPRGAAPAFRSQPSRPPAARFSAPPRIAAPRAPSMQHSATPRAAPSAAARNFRSFNRPSRSERASRPSFRQAPAAAINPSPRNNANSVRGNRNSLRNNAAPTGARIITNPAAAPASRRTVSSPVLRNAAFASRPAWAGRRGSAAAASFRGGFAANGATNGRRWRRGRVIGWVGPLFWPYAYYDVFDYAFYPYYEDTFWPYAYDDVYDGIFGPYAYVGRSVGSAPRGVPSARVRGPDGKPATMAQICTQQSAGLAEVPIDSIARTVQPTDAQKPLLDDLKNATAKAVDILQAACPTDLPSTPTGRLEALEKRLEAMVAAVETVRVPLTQFYHSLSDEQKARFNAVESKQQTENARAARQEQTDMARTCAQGAGVTDVPVQKIAQAVRPTGRQQDALNGLKSATAEAAAGLKANCPNYTALTPVGRVEAMEQRLKTLLQAVRTVRPALETFYSSLSDEQKERFNRLSGQQG
jgi:ABC-type transporter MlaC component